MKRIGVLVCAILIMAAKCNKDGDDCHKAIEVINNSHQVVLFTGKTTDLQDPDLCTFTPADVLHRGESIRVNQLERGCLEGRIRDQDTLQFFFLDTTGYVPDVYYGCDTIQDQYIVLKEVTLASDEIKAMDYVVIYP